MALHGKPQSARDLVPLVGLSRPAVTAALNGTPGGRIGLRDHLLVEQTESGWASVEPTGPATGWFVPREGSGDWSRRIAYWPCCVPSDACPLPTAAVGLVWLVAAMERQKRLTTAAGLAQFLGVSSETVAAGIERLASAGVLSWTRGAGGKTRSQATFAEPLPRAWGDWWEPRHKGEPKVQNPSPAASARITAESSKRASAIRGVEVEPAEGSAPVPPVVPSAPKVIPAEAPPKKDPAGLPDWVRLDWQDVMGKARIRESDRPKILRLVERHWRAVDDMAGQPMDAVEHIQSADDDHDPDKANGRRDCGGLLLHRLAKQVAEAEQDRRVRQHEQDQKAVAFAPLEEAGLVKSNWWPCRTCGEQKCWSVGYVEENCWPDEVRECVATVLAGGCVSRVHVGSVTNLCSSCRAAQPGLVVSATRDELVGRRVAGIMLKDRVIVGGYRHFPDAEAVEALPVGTVEMAQAENERAEDWLMALGPPPA